MGGTPVRQEGRPGAVTPETGQVRSVGPQPHTPVRTHPHLGGRRSILSIPYPSDFDCDYHADWHEERRRRAREGLDPSDVLAEVQSLMLGIADDTQHPLWPLLERCTRVGTATETGKVPHVAEGVGAAFLPLIDKAIMRLVTERLADFGAWEGYSDATKDPGVLKPHSWRTCSFTPAR